VQNYNQSKNLKEDFMKKNFIVFLVLLFLIIGNIGVFAGGGSETTTTEEPVEFEFWVSQTESDRLATIKVIAETYMAMNPDITIKVISVEENDLPQNIQAAVSAGNIPPLLELGAENAINFGSEGIIDLDMTLELINDIGLNNFYKGALELVETPQKGTYYAVPFHGWVQGIWYRTDWFEEAGLEPPGTWETIEKAAEYFYDIDNNQYGILVGTTEENYTEQCFTQFAISNNARIFDKNGNVVFNSPEMREAVEYYTNLAKFNPPGPQTWRARDYYLQGKMAMFFYSTYIMDDLAILENAAGSLTGDNFADLTGTDFDPDLADKTGFVPIISNTDDSSYGVIVALALTEQENEAVSQAARDFAKYLYTNDAYITWLHMAPGGMNPVLKGISDDPDFLNDPKGLYNNYGEEKMNEIISGLSEIKRFGIVEGNVIEAYGDIFSQNIIPQMIYKITQQGMDIDSTMDWAESEIEKIVGN